MVRELLYLLCVALLALETRAPGESEPTKPDALAGVWEAPVKRSLGDGEAVQQATFKDGKFRYEHPGNPSDEKAPRAVLVEGKYTVDDAGRVAVLVTEARGFTKAREGDGFSFLAKLEDGRLLWEDAKGPGLDGIYVPKNGWRLKR